MSISFEEYNDAAPSGIKSKISDNFAALNFDLEYEADWFEQTCYSRNTAVQIVRKFETQSTRRAVFEEVKSKNKLFALVDWAYSKAGFLQPVLIAGYMMKCISAMGPQPDREDQIVSLANFANENHTIDRVLSLIPDVRAAKIVMKRAHFFRHEKIWQYFRFAKNLPKHWRFLRKLVESHDFMPACRIASVIAYEEWFDAMFRNKPELKAALIASNYNPEALALASAAHKHGRKVIYANHAPVPANISVVPPVMADCAVLYGEATRKLYEERSLFHSDAVYIGQPGKTRLMKLNDNIQNVGIFLTALTRQEPLEKLIEAIKADKPDTKILIRNHPVALLETDFSEIAARFSNVKITRATPLEEDIDQSDLVFCGNSGVVMNILRAGKPVAYFADLDSLPYDYLGAVKYGLVCDTKGWSGDLYVELKDFYEHDSWASVMKSHDASYGCKDDELFDKARTKLYQYVQFSRPMVS